MLSDSEGSDGESLHKLTVNEHYAKAFEYKKEREELQKLKDKYGSDFDEDDESETDSESDESEDEDGEELTPAVDAAILRTLARIKRKDPEIYDAKKNIFGEEQQKIKPLTRPAKAPKDKSKPVTIRQVALQSALDPESRSPSPEPLPHVEEQRVLRDETIAAFHNAVEGDADGDDLLIPREKTRDEQELEEEEYRAFLEREVGDLQGLVTADVEKVDADAEVAEASQVVDGGAGKQGKEKKKKARDGEASKETVSSKSRQEADQEFLMNYILNRGWIDRSAKHIPTYGEVTSSKLKGKAKAKHDDPEVDSDPAEDAEGAEARPTSDPGIDEEDFEEIVDRFESSYNFRFEEPDAAVIPTYPRNLPSLVRREDSKRKEARERRKQRKEEELQKKKEEVKRLKSLKMKEIKAKLERIGLEGGKKLDGDEALQELDLEGDWDPDSHDRQMAALYHEDDIADDEKPQWDDDIDIGDIPLDEDIPPTSTTSKKKKKKKKIDENEQDDVGVDVDVMDADVAKTVDDEEWDGTEEMRKRKLDEYMDEIYALDFNDLVGGMPTRFKYTGVQPQNFALTPAEILTATDKELNEYMSIKKYAPYRKSVKWDSQRNERLKEFKSKIAVRAAHSGFAAENGPDAASDKPAKKRKGKKERMKLRAVEADGGGGATATERVADVAAEAPSKRKREEEEGDEEGVTRQDHAQKKKRRRKHKEKDGATV
ncbi:putative KRI1-like family protein [Lyophyllum shimeji]|uniref:KRI1-like family protein n=1 Tax=Lyophyllum shimeji TaxID=47721 RepID=A0A9P3PKW9_LYOSH|nr:putative KRI1-like family protein [Lyophyllum shimeji]